MWSTRRSAIPIALLLVAAALVPATAAAAPLGVEVEQDATGEATVTVTDNGTAVENASVVVDAPNASYAGEGSHETDANGTLTLPAPAEDVTVEVSAAADGLSGSTTAELLAPDLQVEVEQSGDGEATVTVAAGITGETVDNASVNVTTADENVTYAGTGEYVTDDNGTVVLSAPEEDVSIEVAVEAGNVTGSTTADLIAPALDVDVTQDEGGNATVTVSFTTTEEPAAGANVTVTTVDENETYAGTGGYVTDGNGTVALPPPEEDVEVSVVATQGDLDGSTTGLLEATDEESDDGEADSFGARVSAFVHSLLGERGDGDPGIGRTIAAWVLDNNPGDPPAHAGPPDHAAPGDDDRGPHGPDDQADDDDGDGDAVGSAAAGPPDHAGPDADHSTDNSSVAGDEAEDGDDDADENGERGPPDHAGPPADRGNGKAKGR